MAKVNSPHFGRGSSHEKAFLGSNTNRSNIDGGYIKPAVKKASNASGASSVKRSNSYSHQLGDRGDLHQ